MIGLVIRHRTQPDKCSDRPLLQLSLSAPSLFLPARPPWVCTAPVIPAPLQVWGSIWFTALSVAKSRLIYLQLFLDNPSIIVKFIPCRCLHVCFVRSVSWCILFLFFPFFPLVSQLSRSPI